MTGWFTIRAESVRADRESKLDSAKRLDNRRLDRDRFQRETLLALQTDVITAFRNYEFHDIYQKIHNFCVVELGGFYLDITKDRLYTTGAASAPRRSAQTAMHHIAEAMVRWLAPILSFTAEEAWKFLPGMHNESVFLSTWA